MNEYRTTVSGQGLGKLDFKAESKFSTAEAKRT